MLLADSKVNVQYEAGCVSMEGFKKQYPRRYLSCHPGHKYEPVKALYS